jgi:hypothetical protein
MPCGKPSTGTGRLRWHALGPKTIELIHERVHVDAIRDDLETLVVNADLLEAVLGTPDPGKKAHIARTAQMRSGESREKMRVPAG